MLHVRLDLKRILPAVLLLAVLLVINRYFCGSGLVLLGLAAVICGAVFRLPVLEAAAVPAYPLTYLIASLLDVPNNGILPNNLYVFWYFGYFLVLAAALTADFLLRKRLRAVPAAE